MELEGVVDDRVPIGVVGATSLVGGCVLRLIANQNRAVFAFSRRQRKKEDSNSESWFVLGDDGALHRPAPSTPITHWIYVAPIWTLQANLPFLQALGARRIVAISSTSRFTKAAGSGFADSYENQIAQEIADSEEVFQRWAGERGIEWIILRPTLVYGLGSDKNVSEIVRFICRFGWFPLLGNAQGLRQPIHAEDVAVAAFTALAKDNIKARAFNISGGETLTYTEMVSRIFLACKTSTRFVRIPWILFRFAIAIFRFIPRYQNWNSSMAARMNEDLIFDSEDGRRQLGLRPRQFVLTDLDLPVM
jgi:nucleoside-diphosphate-sugar epimerase